MSQFTWTFDAPAGVYKNHELSSKLRYAAIAQTQWMQFVRPEPGYGKKRGESITITRIANMATPTNGRLVENQRIPEDEFVMSNIAITVSEWGRSVPFTNLAAELNVYDLQSMIQQKLRDQMSLTMDGAAAAAFKKGKIKATMTGTTSISFSTNGVAPATGAANLNVYGIEQIRDYMFSTLLIPTYEGDDYLAIVSTKAKRGVISDPNWEKWHQYLSPEYKYRSEVGRLEGFRFIENNNTATLSNSLGSGGVMGEAVFFGADAVAMVVAEDPELRIGMTQDFGRSRAVAWYGILDFGMIWGDSANPGEAKVIHLTSL
jgi:N4-gp56 family major capsid protein